jgi:carbon-monoxide dehydrogenase small subunit
VERHQEGIGMNVTVTVDRKDHHADVEPHVLLVEWLRGIGKTGVHVGCDTSSCGACTVLVDDVAVKSCTMLVVQAAGSEIETIHGLTPETGLSPVQQAFADEHGLQCGFCTPGFIVSTVGLLRDCPEPTTEQVIDALEGNLCRCTGYTSIVRSVHRAAALLRAERPPIEAGRSHEEPLARTRVVSPAVFEDLSDTEVV